RSIAFAMGCCAGWSGLRTGKRGRRDEGGSSKLAGEYYCRVFSDVYGLMPGLALRMPKKLWLGRVANAATTKAHKERSRF
ncbi:MAG TPA: hypothetical protein PLQ01_04465, partial [Methanothrix sp.]|nr:hypothetical protein [Methanothrix sp.]